MIPVGQPYRAAGPINVRSVLSTLILGTVTAVVAALAVWLWEISPIPTLILITPILQGLLIGLVMAFVIGRLRMRNPKLLATIGFACGLASVALVHYGHYIHFLDEKGAEFRAEVEADQTLSPEQKRDLLAKIEHGTKDFVDEALAKHTGHKGFIGSLILRNEIGITIKSAPVTGTALWLLWGAEALLVAGMASAMAGTRAAAPFCEECGDWCGKETGSLTLPGEASQPLADAVRSDDNALLVSLRDHPPETAGDSVAGTILHACPGCDQAFADVWHRVDKVKKGKTESSTKTLVSQLRISPQMAFMLRGGSETPAEIPEEDAEAGMENPR